MADISILNLVALATTQMDDVLVIVDVHDNTQSPAGSTKKIPLTNFFTSPTITTPTITGSVTPTGGTLAIGGAMTVVGSVLVNRVSTASLLGYFGATRNGSPLYYLGQDASDNGVILNAAANAANLTWTDAGNFTTRGNLNIGESSGFAIGSVAARRRIATTGPSGFVLVGDDNGSADLSLRALSASTTVTAGSGLTVTSGGITATGVVTLNGGLSVTTGGLAVTGGATFTTVVGVNGGDTANGELSVSATALNALALNRTESSAALMGHIKLLRNSVAKGFLGLDASDNIAIINAAGNAVNLAVGDTGTITTRGTIISGGDVQAASANGISWAARSLLKSPSDGTITLSNGGATSFTLLQFGGVTSSFPALKRNAAQIEVRLADDSAQTGLIALQVVTATINGSNASIAKILGGSSALSHRNNADSADNLIIDNSGFAIARTYLGVNGTSTGTGAVLDNTGVTVSTSATNISNTATGSGGGLGIARGTDGSNRFTDVVFYDSATATALSSKNTVGSPAARTYTTNAGGVLKLAMASGTYTVAYVELRAITIA